MEFFDHLAEICGKYGIPKENLIVVEDVASAAVEFGWDPPGKDSNGARMAKIKCDICPPKILLKQSIDWCLAADLARMIPVTEEEKRRRVHAGLDRKWFITHLVLHEVAHFILRHHEEDSHSCSHAYEALLVRERAADWWAIAEIEKHSYA